MEKKNTSLIVIIVVLAICLLGVTGYLVYDKVFSKDDRVSEVDNTNSKMKTYLVYDKYTNINDSHGIKVIVDNSNYKILVDNISVFNSDLGTAIISKVYLIDDIIMYEQLNSDGTIAVVFIDRDGFELKRIYQLGNNSELVITFDKQIEVNEDEIILPANYYMNDCSILKDQVHENDIVEAKYLIRYLGKGKFSDLSSLETISYKQKCF